MWSVADDVVEEISKRKDGKWYSLYNTNGDMTTYCFYLTPVQLVEYLDKGYAIVKDGFDIKNTYLVKEYDKLCKYYKKEMNAWNKNAIRVGKILKEYKETYGKEIYLKHLRKDGE